MNGRSFVIASILTIFPGLAQIGIAQQVVTPPASVAHPSMVAPRRHDTSPPVTAMRINGPGPILNKVERRHIPALAFQNRPMRLDPDVLRQSTATQSGAVATPSPGLGFEGLSADDNASRLGGRPVPPDTQGDVSADYYVQMINLVFAVYDKTGNRIYGPEPNNILWSGFGGPCETHNDGDPIVLYDHLANRWLFSQIAIDGNPSSPDVGGHQCFAISTGSDPRGPYVRYDFLLAAGINDYPKIGVWPDGYYLTANEFNLQGTQFLGAMAVAFDRNAMLAGTTVNGVKFLLDSTFCGIVACSFSLQPSHLEGPPPPAGTPNTFVMAFDIETWGGVLDVNDGYRLWNLAANWSAPLNSTFTELTQINTPAFDSELCGYGPCVPQPAPGELLSPTAQFTMYRAQYRNFGTYQAMVLNHTVDAGNNVAGIRWAELRKTPSTGWSLYQTGTFAPADGVHRWMGSIAMDKVGNIALGYSASGTTTFPGVRYNTRTVTDPLGTMGGGEVVMIAGSDVQVNSVNRWGDYSTMSVEPDGCTFWYTQEYQADDGDLSQTRDFKTRIGSFKFDNCSTTALVHDLAITQVTAPSSVNQGDAVLVSVTVANVGNTDVTGDIRVSLNESPDGNTFPDQVLNGLAAGATQLLNFVWQTNTSTSTVAHTLTASHDIGDDNGVNNTKATSITVNTPPPPPANVTVTSISPNSMKAGTTLNGVVIAGAGFLPGAVVTFEGGIGQTPTMSITSVSSTQIQGSISVKSGGPRRNRVWTLRVTNPGGTTGVLNGGFTVTP
jgi:hypothetical protein